MGNEFDGNVVGRDYDALVGFDFDDNKIWLGRCDGALPALNRFQTSDAFNDAPIVMHSNCQFLAPTVVCLCH